MDENEQPYRRYLFTLRFWREELSSGQHEWLGQVQYANDGARCVFRDWPELVAFLAVKLEAVEDDDS